MLGQSKEFQKLSVEERVDFFVKCQAILIAYHPNSEFLFTEANTKERLAYVATLNEKYKGYCYANEHICILFNKIYIGDPNDSIGALQANIYKEPQENYNAVSIDFVVFRDLKDCLQFCKDHYDPRIAYLMFVKNNQPKIYKTEKFISRILSIPILS